MSRTNKSKRKADRFFTGSGKFFSALIIFYLLFIGISELVKTAGNEDVVYNRDEIEINGNEIISNAEILRLCGFSDKNKEKISIDVNVLAHKIMQLKYIQGVSVTRRLPKKLNITVEERQPIAFIHGRGLNLIDRTGYLIPVPNLTYMWDLPLISGIAENLGVLGEKTRSRDAYDAIEFLDYIHLHNPLIYSIISEINMNSPEYFDIYLIRGGANIRVNRTDYKRELYILKSYLVNYLDWKDLHRIDYIDLRFQDQLILRYKG